MAYQASDTPFDYSKLPEWLRQAKRFLLWRLVPDPQGKKPKKLPYYVTGSPRGATDTKEDVARLATFHEALAALRARPGHYQGIGFALGPDDKGGYFQGIDLDDIAHNTYLRGEIATLKGYVEQSPSGNGVHAIGYGPAFAAMGSDGCGVEAYSRSRFFTVTGLVISDAGPEDLGPCVQHLSKYRVLPNATLVAKKLPSEVEWDLLFDVTDERAKELRSALAYLDPDPYDDWISVAYAMKGGGEAAFEIWSEWSARSAKYDPESARRAWNSADPKRTSVGAVFKKAEAAGWPNPRKLARDPVRQADELAANDPVTDPPFEFKTAGELIRGIAPPKYLVDGLIEQEALGLLFGESGLGKSFLAIAWAAAVATGTPWLGREVAQGPVFYIAGEGHGGIGRRLAAWDAVSDAELTVAPMYVSSTAATFMDMDGAARVSAAVERLAGTQPPKLVVIDTFHRNMGAGDENSAEDIASFLLHVDAFIRKKFDCTVLIVHHSGHADKSRARGSSSIAGAMDFIFRLAGTVGGLTLSTEKQKDGEPAPDLHLRLQQIDLTFLTSDAAPATSQVIVEAAAPSPVDAICATLAGRCLVETLQESGVSPDPQLKLAADVTRVVREDTWRMKYLASRATADVKPESLAKDFGRKKKSLLEMGLVFEHEGWVWIRPNL